MGIQLFQCIGEVKQGKGGEWRVESGVRKYTECRLFDQCS
jgi:hypothetical protein